MRILISNGEVEANSDNSYIITAQNDMLNGLFVDRDEEYTFIPEDTEGYPELALTAVGEGITVLDVQSYDATAEPWIWVINSLARMAVMTAQQIIEEA